MSCSQGSEQRTQAGLVSHRIHTSERLFTYLEVDVLQPAHDDAVGGVLWKLKIFPLLQALDVDHGAHKLGVQGALVCETLDVLSCVGIDVLERTSKLVIEPFDEGDYAARDLEQLTLLNDGCLLIVLPLLGALDDDNLLALLKDLEELAELLVGAEKMSVNSVAAKGRW